jgi:hypothetical protein
MAKELLPDAQAAHHPAHCPLRHRAQEPTGPLPLLWLNAPSPGSTASGA